MSDRVAVGGEVGLLDSSFAIFRPAHFHLSVVSLDHQSATEGHALKSTENSVLFMKTSIVLALSEFFIKYE